LLDPQKSLGGVGWRGGVGWGWSGVGWGGVGWGGVGWGGVGWSGVCTPKSSSLWDGLRGRGMPEPD
jgi:hypothetical protein